MSTFQEFFTNPHSGFDTNTAEQDFAGKGRKTQMVIDHDPETDWVKYQLLITVGGWRFSAIWGSGSYCTGARPNGEVQCWNAPSISPDAEVAVYFNDVMVALTNDNQTVIGWITPEQLEAAIKAAEQDEPPFSVWKNVCNALNEST